MSFLPIEISLHDRTVLVIGGGAVAFRKVTMLRRAGAVVHVVAPELFPELAALVESGEATCRKGAYVDTDLEGMFMVVAATDDAAVNARAAVDARRVKILCSVADQPNRGDFAFPAVLRRGDLTVSVSTGGRCPAFAAEVRDRIADVVTDEYGRALAGLAAEREKLLTESNGSTYNSAVLRSRARELVAELADRKGLMP